MENIEPPNQHHLSAAMGWLELGNPFEAGEELARLALELLEHPDVLEVRWSVCAASGSWDAAFDVAETLARVAPERSSGWVHRAYAARRRKDGGLPQAWELLRPVFEKLPQVWLIPYNLACYAAQFGREEEAWEWLLKAAKSKGDKLSIKAMAEKDEDLKALRARLLAW